MATIRNPIEWGMDQIRHANEAVASTSHAASLADENVHVPLPEVRRIGTDDLRDALARGVEDFGARRTDVVFLCLFYPIVGIILARLAFGYDMLPLLFPLASGFALIGPVAGIGLYEISRRRELGHEGGAAHAFGVMRSPSFAGIAVLGLLLIGIYVVWLFAAELIYVVTLGPEPPTSGANFLRDVLTTAAGWAMIIVGMGVGFLFAALVLAISVVSFPMLLDREVSVWVAVGTSLRAVAANPRPMALWGLIVATGLVLGSIPLFLGLIIVMPVLGHATWHLYRKVVPQV
jgi:uncharacterized membrane protein